MFRDIFRQPWQPNMQLVNLILNSPVGFSYEAYQFAHILQK
jgi:hypothetical protein